MMVSQATIRIEAIVTGGIAQVVQDHWPAYPFVLRLGLADVAIQAVRAGRVDGQAGVITGPGRPGAEHGSPTLRWTTQHTSIWGALSLPWAGC